MDKQLRWYSDEINLQHQVIADVGANVGKLSQFFWDSGSGSNEVFSIEPLPQNIKRLRARIKRSKARKWSILPYAVSDTPGEVRLARFHSQLQGWNSSVLSAGAELPDIQGTREVIVQARRLTDLVPNATLVKIDIEGHEYVVIDQAIGQLNKVHTWAVELHMVPERPLESAIQQFEDHGFSVVAGTQRRGDPSGRMISLPITPSLSWAQIPVAQVRPDGSEFKMLHIIARR